MLTGTRAEYGLLRWVLEGIRRSPLLELQLIATGAHLSPEFGLTVNAIVEDGFRVNRRVEMLLSSDTPVGITKSMGIGMIGLADALAEMRPDLMLVVGDRYEIFCGVAAALIARIPVAHIHGGEVTEGVIDESIRHSVTKMSHIHFVSAEPYRKRVIQLGENPQHVFSVGGLGIDNILRLPLLSRPELEQLLEFKLKERNLLVTFHPDTLDNNSSSKQLKELLWALSTLGNTALIFTMPNADTGSRLLFEQILAFCAKHPNARTFKSLGQVGYLSCVRHVDGVVGNSSSGIIEVPSFKKGTINIGDRQRGRLRAGSIIDCEPECRSIISALESLYSTNFQSQLAATENPYGNGGASDAIVKYLETINLERLLKKRFHDVLIQ